MSQYAVVDIYNASRAETYRVMVPQCRDKTWAICTAIMASPENTIAHMLRGDLLQFTVRIEG